MTPQRYIRYEDDPLVVTPKDEIAALAANGEMTSTQQLYDLIRYLLTDPISLQRLCFDVTGWDERYQPTNFGPINHHPNIDMFVENNVMHCVDFPITFQMIYWCSPTVNFNGPDYVDIRTAYGNDTFIFNGPFEYMIGVATAFPTRLNQCRIEPFSTLIKVRAKSADSEVRLRRSSDDETIETFEHAPMGTSGHSHQKWVRSNCDTYLIETIGLSILSTTRNQPQNLYDPNALFNHNIIDLTQTHGYDYTRDAAATGTVTQQITQAQFAALLNITQQMQTVVDATLRNLEEVPHAIAM